MIRSILFIAVCMFALVAASPLRTGYEVGDTVADFKLKNTNGKMVALSDYKDVKGVIVIFDCNTCPVSQAYNSRIIALHDKYAPKGFPVIAIQPNDPSVTAGDSYDEMVKLATEKGYKFAYLDDGQTQKTVAAFGATNTPHTFVLKREGKDFKVAYIGAIDDNTKNASAATKKYVENAVDALLANQAVTTPKTKAIGCSIKWAE